VWGDSATSEHRVHAVVAAASWLHRCMRSVTSGALELCMPAGGSLCVNVCVYLECVHVYACVREHVFIYLFVCVEGGGGQRAEGRDGGGGREEEVCL